MEEPLQASDYELAISKQVAHVHPLSTQQSPQGYVGNDKSSNLRNKIFIERNLFFSTERNFSSLRKPAKSRFGIGKPNAGFTLGVITEKHDENHFVWGKAMHYMTGSENIFQRNTQQDYQHVKSSKISISDLSGGRATFDMLKITMTRNTVPFYTVTALVPTRK